MSLECSLYGLFHHSKFHQIQSLLTAITGSPPERFCEQELVYKPTVETPFGPARNDDIALSLQSNVFESNSLIAFEERHWKLIQRNQPEPPKQGQKLANLRVINQTPLKGNAIEFVELIGYSFWYEFINKGFQFYLGPIRIKIFRIYSLTEKHQIASVIPLDTTESWMIQAIAPRCTQESATRWSNELHALSSQLRGLVLLKVVDHTMLQTKFKYST